jgi:hypothetical protein
VVDTFIRRILTNEKFVTSAMIDRIPHFDDIREAVCSSRYNPTKHCSIIIYHCQGQFVDIPREPEDYPNMWMSPPIISTWIGIEEHIRAQRRHGIDLIPELIIALGYFSLFARVSAVDMMIGRHRQPCVYDSKRPIRFVHDTTDGEDEYDTAVRAAFLMECVERVLLNSISIIDEDLHIESIL